MFRRIEVGITYEEESNSRILWSGCSRFCPPELRVPKGNQVPKKNQSSFLRKKDGINSAEILLKIL